jgi:hypothetical protein
MAPAPTSQQSLLFAQAIPVGVRGAGGVISLAHADPPSVVATTTLPELGPWPATQQSLTDTHVIAA